MFLHGVSSLLIAAAAGYWVLTQAAHQKEQVRKLGELLGLIIIVVSLIGTGCKIYGLIKGGYCPWGPKCPYAGKVAPQPTQIGR